MSLEARSCGMVSRRITGDLDMTYPLVVNDAGIIEPQPIDPAEKFVNADDSGLSETSILDYWVSALSDLVGNVATHTNGISSFSTES